MNKKNLYLISKGKYKYKKHTSNETNASTKYTKHMVKETQQEDRLAFPCIKARYEAWPSSVAEAAGGRTRTWEARKILWPWLGT